MGHVAAVAAAVAAAADEPAVVIGLVELAGDADAGGGGAVVADADVGADTVVPEPAPVDLIAGRRDYTAVGIHGWPGPGDSCVVAQEEETVPDTAAVHYKNLRSSARAPRD